MTMWWIWVLVQATPTGSVSWGWVVAACIAILSNLGSLLWFLSRWSTMIGVLDRRLGEARDMWREELSAVRADMKEQLVRVQQRQDDLTELRVGMKFLIERVDRIDDRCPLFQSKQEVP